MRGPVPILREPEGQGSAAAAALGGNGALRESEALVAPAAARRGDRSRAEARADEQAVATARRVIRTEAEALGALERAIGAEFAAAVELLAAVGGRIVVSGMGKSGHVGRKIAATLASTGTPALFVHPAEASHGDLGMITPADAVLALSNSGETSELKDLTLYTRRFKIPLVALVGRSPSTLAEAADLCLVLPAAAEACPMGLAPTTSTTCMLALGDALAVALLERKGFGAREFAVLHPGGKLGAQLLRVEQIMRRGEQLPLVGLEASARETVLEMTRGCLGCVGVVDAAGKLVGIITDGDLRRHLSSDLLAQRARDIMTAEPRTIDGRALAVEAMALMNDPARPITVLFITEGGRPVGALHLHDCLRAGIA